MKKEPCDEHVAGLAGMNAVMGSPQIGVPLLMIDQRVIAVGI